jgi:hypothetical protein
MNQLTKTKEINLVRKLKSLKQFIKHFKTDIEYDIDYLKKSCNNHSLYYGLIRQNGSELATIKKLDRIKYKWSSILFYYKIEITRIEGQEIFGTFELISKEEISIYS